MENRDALMKTAAKYGGLIGLIQILLTLSLYLMGVEYMVKWWVQIVLFIISITILVIAGKKIRGENGGFIAFGNLFVLILISYVTAALIGTIFSIILFNVIDSNLAVNMQEIIIENTTAMMEKFGAPDEAIEESIANMEDSLVEQFSIKGQMMAFLWTIIVGAVVSAILSAILKKNPNPFEEEEEQ